MKKQVLTALITAFMILLISYPASAGKKETRKIEDAIEVMDAIMAIPEKSIPENLLREAHAIAIVPSVIKVSYGVGGKFGRGIVLVRNKTGWSYPSFITIAGASLGFQIGAQSSDVILIFRTKKSVDGLRRTKFTLGADATVAAGPVGRHGEASTDIGLKAEIYSYSRSRGLFAGVSLEGAAIVTDDKSNADFYNEEKVSVYEIFEGRVGTVPGITHKLISALER